MITGGILAAVILLCIIAVLCYCRLQVSPLGLWPEATSKPLPHHGGRAWRPTAGVTKPKAVECGRRKSRGLGVGGAVRRELRSPHALHTSGTQESELGKYRVAVLSRASEISGVVGRALCGETLKAAPRTPACA